jgi:hypothetical protein
VQAGWLLSLHFAKMQNDAHLVGTNAEGESIECSDRGDDNDCEIEE